MAATIPSPTNTLAITPEVQQEFDANGVVKLTGVIGADWIERFLADAQRQLDFPGVWVTDTNPAASSNRLFTTRYRWETNALVDDFIHQSPIAALAAQLVGSDSLRFYFDHLLIKEPHTPNPTPWHQDIGYWPFMGKQIISAWVPMTAATVSDSSLEFVKGSHKWGEYYAPKSFDGKDGWAEEFGEDSTGKSGGELSEKFAVEFKNAEMPDIQAERLAKSDSDAAARPYEIIGFDVEPGDAIFFSAWTIHWSPGNAGDSRRVAFSTRWLGDDAVWFPHAGCDPTITQDDTTAVPGEPLVDDDRFPLLYEALPAGSQDVLTGS